MKLLNHTSGFGDFSFNPASIQDNMPAFQLFIRENWRYKIVKHGLLNLLLVECFIQILFILFDKIFSRKDKTNM